jgi:hypothetical protein
MASTFHDLGHVTHLLIHNLKEAIKASPHYVKSAFPFEVSGLMPAVTRHDGLNVLSLYLLHVGRDPYWRNTPVQGKLGQLNTAQPLSLNLSYLLTSHSEKNWQMEQYLMSVALEYLHANPIYIGSGAEFTVTVEADSIEEMSRLWQAITVPIRLSAMFRVAVVFLTPEKQPGPDQRTPVEVSLSVGADLNATPPVPEAEPRLFEIAIQVAYRVPPNAADSSQVVALRGQPAVAEGESVRVRGSGLDTADGAVAYLMPAGVPVVSGQEWPIPSAWRIAGTPSLVVSASGTASNADEMLLRLPASYGDLPAWGMALTATPPPGKYMLAVGNAPGAFPAVRSNALPVSIAPQMSGIGPSAPVLQPSGGVYTFTASGLVAGQTTILLDQTALAPGTVAGPGVAAMAENAGLWTVTFELPAPGFTSGTYVPVRVVANSIEAPPGWWVLIP